MNPYFDAVFRSSDKKYFARPKAGTSARIAWGWLIADGKGSEPDFLRLLDGYWGMIFKDGKSLEIEAQIVRDECIEQRAKRKSTI